MHKVLGIPTEIKQNEKRVALIPAHVQQLVQAGVKVFIQQGAGERAGFADSDYTAAGATLQPDSASLYAAANLIVKVKEPLAGDLQHLKAHHTLFCYLHLAPNPELTTALKNIGLTAIAFETLVRAGGTPLLAPMSAIAGRLAIHIASWYLHSPRGGRGVLLGGIADMPAGNIVVLGAGVAGREAATLAHNMGANVQVLDLNEQRLHDLKKALPRITTHISTPQKIAELLPNTDALIGTVYVLGKRAPVVVSEPMVQTMPKGSVIVDVSIDQGGCIATSSPCTHDEPVYTRHGVIHSAITNMPAAAPRTASEALSAAILSDVLALAVNTPSPELTAATNVAGGEVKGF